MREVIKKFRPEFEVLNSINETKKNVLGDIITEKDYVPFFINKSLSYHPDTLFHSNEMNFRHFLPKKMQYDYLLHSVRKRKRFSKWLKGVESDELDSIIKYYNISKNTAIEYIKLLTKDQIAKIVGIYGG